MPCPPRHAPSPLIALLLGWLACANLHAAPLSISELALPGQAQGSIIATERSFVLSWIDREADGSAALRFAELDHDGALMRRGDITQGKGWFVNWADFPSLAVADNGDWLSYVLVKSDPTKPYAYDIHTTRSTDRGISWSSPAILHDDGTTTEHGFVSLLPDGGDRVLAVWLDGRHTRQAGDHGDDHHSGAHTALHSAVLTRDGIIERRELDDLTCDCCRTVALRTGEGPLVAYRNRSPGEVRDIFSLQRGGAGWSLPERVHDDHWVMPGCPVNGPAMTTLGSSSLIAWPTLADGDMSLRMARRIDGTWQRLANLDRGDTLIGRVDLAPWSANGALAAWLSSAHDGRTTLKLARLDHEGNQVEQHVVTTLPEGRSTGMPRIAAREGRAILLWTQPTDQGPRLHGVLIRSK